MGTKFFFPVQLEDELFCEGCAMSPCKSSTTCKDFSFAPEKIGDLKEDKFIRTASCPLIPTATIIGMVEFMLKGQDKKE